MPGNTLKLSGKVREFYFAEAVETVKLLNGCYVVECKVNDGCN